MTNEKNVDVEVKTTETKPAMAEKTPLTTPPREVYRSPFRMMRHFAEDMEDMLLGGFDRTFPKMTFFDWDPFDFERKELFTNFTPPVEIFEKDGFLIVRTDLPGMTKDDIDVEIIDGRLMIKGERKNEFEEKKEGYFRTERTYGTFYRALPLPKTVELTDAKAIFKDGVLEVRLAAPKGVKEVKKLEITEAEPMPEMAATAGKF
jgi:HSP20 family protein